MPEGGGLDPFGEHMNVDILGGSILCGTLGVKSLPKSAKSC